MKLAYAVIIIFTFIISGCATVTSSDNQSITIKAVASNGDELDGVRCRLNNPKGEWTTVTPQSVNIRKAFGDLNVDCRKDKITGTKVVQSSSNGNTIANALFLGPVGIIGGALIDAGTGNGYAYPNSIIVDMLGNIAPSKQ